MDDMHRVWNKTFTYMFEDMEAIQRRENNVFNKWCLHNQRRVMGRGGEITGAVWEIICMINMLYWLWGCIYRVFM